MKRTGGGADRQDLRDLQKQNAAGGSSKNIHFQRFGGIDRIGFPENIARGTFCHQIGIAPEVLFYNVYTPLQHNADACDGFPIGKMISSLVNVVSRAERQESMSLISSVVIPVNTEVCNKSRSSFVIETPFKCMFVE